MTGLSKDQIKDLSPEELRSYLEMQSKKEIRIVSKFPSIGRGNALQDNLVK